MRVLKNTLGPDYQAEKSGSPTPANLWCDFDPREGNGLEFPPPPPRSTDRQHVSEILRYIAQETRILPQDDEDMLSEFGLIPDLPDSASIRVSLGLAWEEWFARHYRPVGEYIYHPGEFECDGIVGSPDAVETADLFQTGTEQLIVHEYKLTWKYRFALNIPWIYLKQIMCYCHMLGTDLAYLAVYHVTMDGGRRPGYATYLIQFDGYELAENWKMILRNREGARGRVRKSKIELPAGKPGR